MLVARLARWSALLAALCVPQVALFTGMLQPADAGIEPCIDQAENDFAGGATTYQDSIYGARARIEPHNPDLCGPESDVSAWVMIVAGADANPSNKIHYAQVGYLDSGTSSGVAVSGYHRFAEWTKSCNPNCVGPEFRFEGDAAPTGNHLYSVYLKSDIQRVVMVHDGEVLGTTGYDPADVWDSAWRADFEAESFHRRSDIPGITSDHVSYYQIQRFEPNGDINFIQQFGGIPASKSCSCSRYHLDEYSPSVGGLGFQTWTYPLE